MDDPLKLLNDLNNQLPFELVVIIKLFVGKNQMNYMNACWKNMELDKAFLIGVHAGDLKLLKWVQLQYKNFGTWIKIQEDGEQPCFVAKTNNHDHIRRWMMNNGCPCRKQTCIAKHSDIQGLCCMM